MQFRQFNQAGVQQVSAFIDLLRLHSNTPVPTGLLFDDAYTEPLASPMGEEPVIFVDRMDFADWLHNTASKSTATVPRRSVGFWTWMTLMLFDQICPANGNGQRKPREQAWYIPAFDDSRRHYRHVLYGSYEIYYQYRDDPAVAGLLLANQLTTLGHFWYQLASRQDLVTNPAVVGAATKLYLDSSQKKAKRGSTSQKSGGIFRFVKVLNQFDRVWDLRLRGVDGIIELLPQEFSRFAAPS